MVEKSDIKLLREYGLQNSEEAFATLVQRHIRLVYSVALRQLGNAHQAEEVTQAVFIILARKAAAFPGGTPVSGWLYQTARLTTANFQRSEMRRLRREQEAHMQSVIHESKTEQVWEALAPLLDEGMGCLSEKERNAIVVRYFEGRTFAEAAVALGSNEASVQRRSSRAVEKLRNFFARRGVKISAGVLVGAISANSLQAAPAGLSTSVTASAMAKGAMAGPSTLNLIKGALKLMAWTKVKTIVVISVAAVLTTGTVTVAVKKILPPTMDESFWMASNSSELAKMPKTIIIRPTKYPKGGGWFSVGENRLGRDENLQNLVALAYNADQSRIEWPPSMPKGKFDFLVNLPTGGDAGFRAQLKKQFGITAHDDKRDKDILLMKVKTPNAPGLKPTAETFGGTSSSRGRISMKGMPVSALAAYLEQYFKKPVNDETGLTGKYDIELKWANGSTPAQIKSLEQALANDLGLELVPSTETIDVLVVEKVK